MSIQAEILIVSSTEQVENARKALRLIREDGWRIQGAARFFKVPQFVIHEVAECELGKKCKGKFGCRVGETPSALPAPPNAVRFPFGSALRAGQTGIERRSSVEP